MLTGDIPPGRGLWEPLTSSAVVIQTWFARQSEFAAQLGHRRQPLTDTDRVDLTPFMPRAADPSRAAGAIIPAGPSTATEPADGVTDLGELVFDLADLQIDNADPMADPSAQDDSPR